MLLVLLCVTVIALMFYLFLPREIQRGTIAGDYGASDTMVSDSEFLTFINTNMVVENNIANVLIQNSEANHNACRVKLYENSGVLLYESDTIPTGYSIESAKLFTELQTGEYDCYAIIEILQDDASVKSTTTVGVTVTVI